MGRVCRVPVTAVIYDEFDVLIDISLQMLEVWNEIKVELEQENIRPVSPDADCMVEISRILNDRAAGVSSTQVSEMKERRGRDRKGKELSERTRLFGRRQGRERNESDVSQMEGDGRRRKGWRAKSAWKGRGG